MKPRYGPRPTMPPRNLAMAFVMLRLSFTDAQGYALEATTWTVGRTPEVALADWKRAKPKLAAMLTAHATLTKAPGREREAFTERVEVADELLAKAGVGMAVHPRSSGA